MKEDLRKENDTIEEQQIKSRQRVKDHGEVFTNPREVNAMLDLVKDESYRVDSRFLEPACGNGNFLVEILSRKLETVRKAHSENLVNFKKHIFIAVSSIYAIDIQEDNCQESRQRMYDIIECFYKEIYPQDVNQEFLLAIKEVLELNVILGNGLSGLQVNKGGKDIKSKPIVFSEWEFDKDVIIRKDFEMNKMIAHENKKKIDKELNTSGLFGIVNKNENVEEKEMEPSAIYEYRDYKELSSLKEI